MARNQTEPSTGRPGRPRTLRLFGALLASLAVVATVLAACGGDENGSGDGSSATTPGGGRLVVYSGRSEELVGPLFERFEQETGVDLDVRYGESDDLALAIEQEGDRGAVDVFISQSPGAVGFLSAADLLQPIDPAVLDRVRPEDRSSQGTWVGLSARARVLAYNTDELTPDQLPGSVFDLTDPVWSGRVGIAPTNGSFIDFVSGMRQLVGDERTEAWLAGMAANASPTYPGNSPILEAVARAEVPTGLVNHYYREIAIQENPDLPAANHFFPNGDPGSMLLVTAAAVPTSASDPAGAAALLGFLLSDESQRYLADDKAEYPLAVGVAPPGSLPPLTDLPVTRLDLDRLGDDLTSTIDMIRASGLQE
ncbi:MAG: extracellular solute-binding protein [Microthrixaceae bacterium]